MSKYADRQFWIDTADRAVATFAQGTLGALTADAISILDAGVAEAAQVGALTALASVLYSIAFRGGAVKE